METKSTKWLLLFRWPCHHLSCVLFENENVTNHLNYSFKMHSIISLCSYVYGSVCACVFTSVEVWKNVCQCNLLDARSFPHADTDTHTHTLNRPYGNYFSNNGFSNAKTINRYQEQKLVVQIVISLSGLNIQITIKNNAMANGECDAKTAP